MPHLPRTWNACEPRYGQYAGKLDVDNVPSPRPDLKHFLREDIWSQVDVEAYPGWEKLRRVRCWSPF